MAKEDGIDCDLEPELENLTFLEEQNITVSTTNKMRIIASKKAKQRDRKKNKQHNRNASNKMVMPDKDTKANKHNASIAASNTSTPASPKGRWKTTRHGIHKDYGPVHP